MKTIIAILFSCFLFSSCLKMENLSEIKQEINEQEQQYQEVIVQEIHTPDILYIFDIDSFKYLDEFPRTIEGVKELYPDEPFEESLSEYGGKSYLGAYGYSLRSSNIQFIFGGDAIDELELRVVDIFNSNYQCEPIQVIGMTIEKLEKISGKNQTHEKAIKISSELYILLIETKNGIASSYSILAQL